MVAICCWDSKTFGSEGDVYETGCGNDFTFIDGTPKENSFKFCPYCGGEIEDVMEQLGRLEKI